MAKKKSVKKKTAKKVSKKQTAASKKNIKKAQAARKKAATKSVGEVRLEKAVMENFVSLQRVLVNLSGELGELNKKLTGLLGVFETSAKALVQKDFDVGEKSNQELKAKVNEILEQNKLIARGVTLMSNAPQQNYSQPTYLPQQVPQVIIQSPQAMPPQAPVAPAPPQQQNPDTYQQSIANLPKNFKRLPKR